MSMNTEPNSRSPSTLPFPPRTRSDTADADAGFARHTAMMATTGPTMKPSGISMKSSGHIPPRSSVLSAGDDAFT